MVNEANFQPANSTLINGSLADINNHIIQAKSIKIGDLQYINCLGLINQMGIKRTGVLPNFIKTTPEFENKSDAELKDYCKEKGMANILAFFEIMEACHVGSFNLTATGRLIGWLNLEQFSTVDIKELF